MVFNLNPHTSILADCATVQGLALGLALTIGQQVVVGIRFRDPVFAVWFWKLG